MSSYKESMCRVTSQHLIDMKRKGEKVAMITAYDYSMASIVDKTGIEIVLVGDSAANVMEGHSTTLSINLDRMIGYAQSVRKAIKRALVCVDMPFGSYQSSSLEAVSSAIRIIKETGADAVKMEGGKEIRNSVERILSAGIPVMGHLGLTPQSICKFGTYAVRARKEDEAQKLIQDALLLEKWGCFSLVLEKIPADLGKQVSEQLLIPTIGIGAGVHTDGQVLVLHDMLGINKSFTPRFVRKYADLYTVIREAVENYVKDVKKSNFPSEQESY